MSTNTGVNWYTYTLDGGSRADEHVTCEDCTPLHLRTPDYRISNLPAFAEQLGQPVTCEGCDVQLCRCGDVHREPRAFYVSILRGRTHQLAAGPYATHAEALDRVEIARKIANELDPYMHFAAWGTLSLPVEETTRPGLTEYVEKWMTEHTAEEGVSPSEEDGYRADENDLEDDTQRVAETGPCTHHGAPAVQAKP